MQCMQVSELQGNMQDLQEALDKETAAYKESQSTLEEAYRHRNRLEARYTLDILLNYSSAVSCVW